MRSIGLQSLRDSLASLMVVVLAVAVLAISPLSSACAEAHGSIAKIKVHGEALEGNLEGASPDRTVLVYLPPSYKKDKTRRYPVVYLLHDYLVGSNYWIGVGRPHIVPGIDLPGAMDRDLAAGTAREMILVMPDAKTKYGGSMYSSSVTTGDWETYIAKDLVNYIDAHYRTLADPASRGLAGHSMGGYGTIRIAMKRPGVFSSIYILSACCLINNPAFFRHLREKDGTDGSADGNKRRSRYREQGGPPIGDVIRAEAAAWSPNPSNPPTYFDLPGTKGALVAARWAANSPLAMIDQYIPALRQYSAIAMDVGSRDGFRKSNEKLSNILTAYGIKHSFEIYDGDHVDRIGQRMEKKVLPFFSKHLAFGRQP